MRIVAETNPASKSTRPPIAFPARWQIGRASRRRHRRGGEHIGEVMPPAAAARVTVIKPSYASGFVNMNMRIYQAVTRPESHIDAGLPPEYQTHRDRFECDRCLPAAQAVMPSGVTTR